MLGAAFEVDRMTRGPYEDVRARSPEGGPSIDACGE